MKTDRRIKIIIFTVLMALIIGSLYTPPVFAAPNDFSHFEFLPIVIMCKATPMRSKDNIMIV